MDLADTVRLDIALHPPVVKAFEGAADVLLEAAVKAGEALALSELPLSSLLKPVADRVAEAARAWASAEMHAELDRLIQAQANCKPGDGKAGLVSIEEVSASK